MVPLAMEDVFTALNSYFRLLFSSRTPSYISYTALCEFLTLFSSPSQLSSAPARIDRVPHDGDPWRRENAATVVEYGLMGEVSRKKGKR